MSLTIETNQEESEWGKRFLPWYHKIPTSPFFQKIGNEKKENPFSYQIMEVEGKLAGFYVYGKGLVRSLRGEPTEELTKT